MLNVLTHRYRVQCKVTRFSTHFIVTNYVIIFLVYINDYTLYTCVTEVLRRVLLLFIYLLVYL